MFGFLRKAAPPQVDPGVQDAFVERVRTAAEAVRQALPLETQQILDYSPGSLARLDQVALQVQRGEFTLTPLQRVGIAAYVYEVARGCHGGLYEVCDDEDPVVLVVGEPEFAVCLCAISHVERRLAGHEPEPLPAFYARHVDAVRAARSEVVR
ncbi:hypothetical protein [Bordetella sp. 2513F-2]